MQHHAYRLTLPDRRLTPVIFASPHSGAEYGQHFLARTPLDARMIRSSEDAFVDRLFDMAPRFGAPLLAARMPRAYLDLNRACDELDPALIEGVARPPHNPRVASGLGVIPRVVAGGRPIYRGKISLTEAQTRIDRYWRPYHAALATLIEESHAAFGQAVLIDCHSMPHEAIASHARPGQSLPEVVLGDRFGASAGRQVIEEVEAAFCAAGFRVARNTPFAGAFVTQAYGRPSRGQHVIQVEIDRSLYMDEAAIKPRPDFGQFRRLMAGVVAKITGGRHQPQALAAE